jgi:hypothetical protein
MLITAHNPKQARAGKLKNRRAISVRLAGIAVGIVLVIGVAGFELYFSSNAGSPSATVSSQTKAPSGTSTLRESGSASTSAASSLQGVQFTMSLGKLTVNPGNSLTISLAEYNPAYTATNVSRASSWPLGTLNLGPCGTAAFPFGIAVFQGRYLGSDISTGTPLRVFRPSAPCSAAVTAPAWYAFQPKSSLAVTSTSATSVAIEVTFNVNGTWNGGDVSGNGATFSGFAPGGYTVAGGDEWGHLVVEYFFVPSA